MRVAKIGLWTALFVFLLSALSLALGHEGVAIKIINISFFGSFLSCLFGIFLKTE